jgi:protein-S-isoprenylcysteine O-methyltransferase Ste14
MPPLNGLFVRALVAFLALPGVVAFLIPIWVLARPNPRWRPDGLLVVSLGTLILLRCVREFYVAGRGTLAPWSPPRHLVTTGLYRFSRNPMYVGVIIILIGWSLVFRSRGHAVYAAITAVAFHVRVVGFEEPWLARTHGEAWRAYRAHVRRWFLW